MTQSVYPPLSFHTPPSSRCHSFYYTPDQRIAITGGTTCLELDVPFNENDVEFRTCKTGNSQQRFTIENVTASVTSMAPFPDPTTICHRGVQAVLSPTEHTNITLQVRLRRCGHAGPRLSRAT
jgi:hypothetical protein